MLQCYLHLWWYFVSILLSTVQCRRGWYIQSTLQALGKRVSWCKWGEKSPGQSDHRPSVSQQVRNLCVCQTWQPCWLIVPSLRKHWNRVRNHFYIYSSLRKSGLGSFLASTDAHEVMWVSEWSLADFTDVTLVSEVAFERLDRCQ